MEITVLAFGQLAEITGSSFTVNNVHDTDTMIQELYRQFPAITSIPFKLAVDKKIINANTPISNLTSIALLPPFSGG